MNEICENKENRIIYDWISFTSRIHSTASIIDFLGLGSVSFEVVKGFYGYHDRLYFNGISIHYNGSESRHLNGTILVEMSGKGCRTWEKYGNSDYNKLFSTIIDNYSDNPDLRKMNITRLDVAFDDFSGVIDLKNLAIETQLGNFVSRFSDWECVVGNKGLSVNHGSKKSNIYIRIYDKRMEQNLPVEKCPHWVRLELQIRKECSLGFIQSDLPIQESYYRTLNNYLRYIIPSLDDSNKRRCLTAPYWLKLLESAERHSIFCKPADSYSFGDLHTYVTQHMSGAIQTVIDCIGVEQFLTDVKKARKGKTLNAKYVEVKKEYKADWDEHGQNILEAIGEA